MCVFLTDCNWPRLHENARQSIVAAEEKAKDIKET
jgi:hypothetical protein